MTSLKSVFLPVFDPCNKALKQAEFRLFIYLFISILFFFYLLLHTVSLTSLVLRFSPCVEDVFCLVFFLFVCLFIF